MAVSQSSPVPRYLTLCGPVDTCDCMRGEDGVANFLCLGKLTRDEFVEDVSDRAEYEGAHNREMDRGITGKGKDQEGKVERMGQDRSLSP